MRMIACLVRMSGIMTAMARIYISAMIQVSRACIVGMSVEIEVTAMTAVSMTRVAIVYVPKEKTQDDKTTSDEEGYYINLGKIEKWHNL